MYIHVQCVISNIRKEMNYETLYFIYFCHSREQNWGFLTEFGPKVCMYSLITINCSGKHLLYKLRNYNMTLHSLIGIKSESIFGNGKKFIWKFICKLYVIYKYFLQILHEKAYFDSV